MHKLCQLAEMGVDRKDPGLEAVGERALARISPEGPPEIPVNIPERSAGRARTSGHGSSATRR